MRRYRGADGEQLWFDRDEIDSIIDDELTKAGLMPTAAQPVVDLERFIEQHLGAELDQYAVLDGDVLGLTELLRRPARVRINADLTHAALDDKDASRGLVGRWRATLGHEAGHVVLHGVLFDTDQGQARLFGDDDEAEASPQGLMRCLNRDVGYAVGTSDWREVQANRAMAALLMPRELYKEIVREAMMVLGITAPAVGSPDASVLARELADRFAVSHQAAKIRLETLTVLTPPTSTPQLST